MLQVYACVALYAAIFAICTCIKILVYGLRTDPDLVNITDPWSFTKPGFLAPTGAQGVTIFVRSSVRSFVRFKDV